MAFRRPDNLIEAKTLTSPNGERTQIGIAIVKRNDQFLIGIREKNNVLGGLSEFPGGKCEPEEEPSDCARRECWEETGLRVRIDEPLTVCRHDYPHGALELHFFLCSPAADEVPVPKGSFVWVDRTELLNLNFPEANAAVVQLLARG
ncbi:MAG: (deoxy)nucleoside triphosphate pyrophosphohydrolase [Planctomycetaceae bacterium]